MRENIQASIILLLIQKEFTKIRPQKSKSKIVKTKVKRCFILTTMCIIFIIVSSPIKFYGFHKNIENKIPKRFSEYSHFATHL